VSRRRYETFRNLFRPARAIVVSAKGRTLMRTDVGKRPVERPVDLVRVHRQDVERQLLRTRGHLLHSVVT
jgi:hypothetical protein